MKKAFYEFLRFYVRMGLRFYFTKIEVRNIENIPNGKPLLFTANHQNAFLDALLVVAFNRRNTYFLARASIFGHPMANWLLSLFNMMPIYRIRDGKFKLTNNEAIFQKCYKLLEKGSTLLIFPEGNHDLHRRLRPLSKGFTRIAFGALEETTLSELLIVPIGLNYQHHYKFRSRVSIIFGEPIKVSTFNPAKPILLREAVALKMKELITHIEEPDYEQKIGQLKAIKANFLYPEEINALIKIGGEAKTSKEAEGIFQKLLFPVAFLNNVFVVLIWKLIKTFIKDPAFIGSIKFAFGIFIVPVIYLLQSLIILSLFGTAWTIGYLFFSVVIARYLPGT